MRSVRTKPCFIHELISAVRCPKLDRHLSVFQLWIECNLLKETSGCSQDLDLSTTESLLAQLENDTRDNSKDHEVRISLFLVKLAISVFQSTRSNQCLHLIFGANGLARWNCELADSLAKHCGAHSPMPLRYLLIRFIRQYLQRLAALNPNEPMAAHFINSVQQLPLPSIIKDSLSLAHLRVVL